MIDEAIIGRVSVMRGQLVNSAEQAACRLSIRFTVTCVAITAFDGDRWPAVRILALAARPEATNRRAGIND